MNKKPFGIPPHIMTADCILILGKKFKIIRGTRFLFEPELNFNSQAKPMDNTIQYNIKKYYYFWKHRKISGRGTLIQTEWLWYDTGIMLQLLRTGFYPLVWSLFAAGIWVWIWVLVIGLQPEVAKGQLLCFESSVIAFSSFSTQFLHLRPNLKPPLVLNFLT